MGGCEQNDTDQWTDDSGRTYHREFISHPEDPSKRVEIFWTKPPDDGPFPAIVFVHGHQGGDRPGGRIYVDIGRLAKTAERGFVAVAVSQPGYGNSTGGPDFCGPFSQAAVIAAIDRIRDKPFVNADKIGLFGFSRGAIVAGMVAAKDPRLAAVAVAAGLYDLAAAYPMAIDRLNRHIESEAGTSAKAFADRSAALHAAKIKSPVLILHGARDDVLPADQAIMFYRRLIESGADAELRIFPDAGHRIPSRPLYEAVYPFFDRHL